MTTTADLIQAPTAAAALAEVNKTRLANKNRWVFLQVEIPGHPPLMLKSFNLSIQILRKNNVNFGGKWDCNATEWKATILCALEA